MDSLFVLLQSSTPLADEQQHQQQQQEQDHVAVDGQSAYAIAELHRADTLSPHL